MSNDNIIDVEAKVIDDRLSSGQQKIQGYRDLSADEIETINKIKTTAALVGELVDTITKMESARADFTASPETIDAATNAMRWASQAKTHLQTGFMMLTRAVAKPSGF